MASYVFAKIFLNPKSIASHLRLSILMKFLFTSRNNTAQCILKNYFCASTHMRARAHLQIQLNEDMNAHFILIRTIMKVFVYISSVLFC